MQSLVKELRLFIINNLVIESRFDYRLNEDNIPLKDFIDLISYDKESFTYKDTTKDILDILKEISEELNITRSAVFDAIKKASNMLEFYESKLELYAKEKQKRLLLEKIDELDKEAIIKEIEKL